MKGNVLTQSVYRCGRFRFRFRLLHRYSSIARVCAHMIAGIDDVHESCRFTFSGRLVARSATYQGV